MTRWAIRQEPQRSHWPPQMNAETGRNLVPESAKGADLRYFMTSCNVSFALPVTSSSGGGGLFDRVVMRPPCSHFLVARVGVLLQRTFSRT